MLFKLDSPSAQAVTGRNLAHGRRSASQRAATAARLVLGELALVDPTIGQAAVICGVCVPYVRCALDVTDAERAALAAGDAAISSLAPPIADALVESWNAASSAERIEFARRVGAEELWQDAVAPAITPL